MKPVIFFVLLFVITATAKAVDCPAYIIKITGDTVRGVLDVPTNKALLNKRGIDFGGMWMDIKFSETGKKSQKMKAGDIAGFGFTHEGQSYNFEVLDMQKNYGQKAPKLFSKKVNDYRFFVHRIEDGPLPIYKEYWNSENIYKDNNTGRERVTGYSGNEELYVKTVEHGYVEIAPTTLNGQKKLKEFLKKYLKLEDEFLNTVDEKARFQDAEEILKKYNAWKKSKS